MKTLKNIFNNTFVSNGSDPSIYESHYSKGNQLDPDVSRYYWAMKQLVMDKFGQFKQIYKNSLRQKLIDFIKSCGSGAYSTVYIKPVKIEFDYNIKGGYTSGLICGFWCTNDDVPVMYVDCLDDQPMFGVNIDKLVSASMLRLRNNVLVDWDCLYDLIVKGDIAYTISKSDCYKLKKEYYDRSVSDAGSIADNLRSLLKSRKYDEFVESIKTVITRYGKTTSKGSFMPLKRNGRFWNCFISELSIVNNTVWVNAYEAGDLSDNDDEIQLLQLLKLGKKKFLYKGETFTVDMDSINDMIDDIEYFINEQK